MSVENRYNPLVSKIYRSRNVLLDILKHRGFNVEDYEGFSVGEIHIMVNQKQLDMLLEHPKTNTKIYIKYHLGPKLKPSHIYETVEDLFEIEELLTEKDELIIVGKDKINDSLKNCIKQIFLDDKRFCNLYNLNNYLFNILNHVMVPPHKILTEDEKKAIVIKYNITDMSQFPEVSRFDPVAQALGMRPGEVSEITRRSPTAITTFYYRYCCH